MRKINSKQKDLSTLQKIKFYGIFFIVTGFAFSFEVFFQTLLLNVICISILCILVYMGMELYTRHSVKFGGKSTSNPPGHSLPCQNVQIAREDPEKYQKQTAFFEKFADHF